MRLSPLGVPRRSAVPLDAKHLFDTVEQWQSGPPRPRSSSRTGHVLRAGHGPRTVKDRGGSRYYITARSVVSLTPEQRSSALLLCKGMQVAKFNFDVHERNVRFAHRLSGSSWPRSKATGLTLWPSSPTLPEWLEMSRKGKIPCQEAQPTGKTCRVSRRLLLDIPELARRIVRRHIVGLRSDIEVPLKFMGHFRYRRGFLILTTPHVPIGLARFLLSQWVIRPTSLWLEWYGTLKQYLRRVPAQFLTGPEFQVPSSEYDSDE